MNESLSTCHKEILKREGEREWQGGNNPSVWRTFKMLKKQQPTNHTEKQANDTNVKERYKNGHQIYKQMIRLHI